MNKPQLMYVRKNCSIIWGWHAIGADNTPRPYCKDSEDETITSESDVAETGEPSNASLETASSAAGSTRTDDIEDALIEKSYISRCELQMEFNKILSLWNEKHCECVN